jgi:hypothetical protein
MNSEEQAKLLATCKEVRGVMEDFYKATGGHIVVVHLPLFEALKWATLTLTSGVETIVNHENVSCMLEFIQIMSSTKGVTEKDLSACPQPWKYEMFSSLVSAIGACEPKELEVLMTALRAYADHNDAKAVEK